MAEQRVMIAGGGLGGCCAALALAKLGIRSVVYELRSSRGTLGGAVALAPNALRVLDRLGIYEKIKPRGFVYEELHFTDFNGWLLGTYYNGSKKLFGYPALRVQRTIVHEVIVQACEQSGCVEIKYDHGVESINEDEQGVTVTFSNGSKATGPILIGADGLHSKVRHHIYGKEAPSPTYSGNTGIGATTDRSKIRFPQKDPYLPAVLFGQQGMCAFMPQDPEGQRVGYFSTVDMPEMTRDEIPDFIKNRAADVLRKRFKGWPDPVNSIVENLDPESLVVWVQYSAPVIEKWSTKRVVILGDAAHAIPPSGGQGAAQAFEDTAVLARIIQHNREKFDKFPAAVFDKFHELRRDRLEVVRQFTKLSGDSRQGTSPIGWFIKKWSMWAFFHYFKRGTNDKLYDYDIEQVDVSISD